MPHHTMENFPGCREHAHPHCDRAEIVRRRDPHILRLYEVEWSPVAPIFQSAWAVCKIPVLMHVIQMFVRSLLATWLTRAIFLPQTLINILVVSQKQRADMLLGTFSFLV
jgi:hypothetical protein